MTAIDMNKTAGIGINSLQAHVRQSISDIITTPVGSRVMRREYGSLIPDLIDQPINQTTLLRIYAATAAAVMRWEPRIKISRISMRYVEPAGALVEVAGRLEGDTIRSEVRIGGGL